MSAGFPPAFLLTGTRDLLLSDTVRMHRVIHRAGITTELHVHEAMPHAFQVIDDQLPESREAYRDMMQFFDKHLAGSGAVPTSSSKMESFGA